MRKRNSNSGLPSAGSSACMHTHTHILFPLKKMYTALIIHYANYPSRIQNNVIYILKQCTNVYTVVKFCKLEKYTYGHITDRVLTENSVL